MCKCRCQHQLVMCRWKVLVPFIAKNLGAFHLRMLKCWIIKQHRAAHSQGSLSNLHDTSKSIRLSRTNQCPVTSKSPSFMCRIQAHVLHHANGENVVLLSYCRSKSCFYMLMYSRVKLRSVKILTKTFKQPMVLCVRLFSYADRHHLKCRNIALCNQKIFKWCYSLCSVKLFRFYKCFIWQ